MKAYESEELTRQARVLNELSTAAERLFWNHAVHQHSQVIILSMIGVSLLAAGGWQVAQGSITTGELLAFFVGAGFLNTSLATASQATSGVASGSVSLEKLADVLDSASAPAYTGTARVAFAGSFALEDVTFTYGTQVVLRNVSMTAGAGERVAIIGPNGAGKTTLMNVLLGFLRPSGGEVLADGRPYRELDLRQLRRQVGVVMQRPTFFFGSIRDNVAYGHPEASDPDIDVATRLSHAHEFIATLPSGLDTAIGESGVTLSGGECQRLALARALMGQPRALILDEPTNHLDVSVVGSLLESLDHTYGKLTMILVSHDPRIVGFADRVYLLNEGRLSELERGGAVPFATATGSPVATAVVA
jgi:ABC-type bacteriocin/lantibiotic exporter with double-glycine peptidase domain